MGNPFVPTLAIPVLKTYVLDYVRDFFVLTTTYECLPNTDDETGSER